ncbi:alpha/beta hydrolase [Microbacterium sp.]|uniref:alpha/beta hydrolase n=1 Tax=Microbacterium sp. TaxID=51671 RepID=UPI002D773520|nr:alpha/beta hydrolase-fold protein [Microbacterium sp.]HET6302641.1 alpha/beta hydrolase-fold protein [Microbacterium sp.]
MTVLLRRNRGAGASIDAGAERRRSRLARPFTAVGVALAMVLSSAPLAAQADDVDLTPGPTIVKDENSPTGYTGHFVYYNPDATSVRFVADILLRNWEDPSDTTVYQPSEYRPGLMRGGGAYDVEMTPVGDGYWVHDVPLAAGVNQYWFYVNNNTNLWVTDPANSPIYAPDGLTGTARRAFNKVYVPYDAEKQNYAPLAAREIENERPDTAKGTWSYVEIPSLPPLNGIPRTIGVYLPPGYDENRAEPYKLIYMQHGGGQDQSDWMNIGDVPVIMDNLLADGLTEPAVVITTNTNYLGAANQGYPNLRNIVMPFVEENYNVSTKPIDRAFAGLSAGSFVTQNIINFDPTLFGWYGPWSGGVSVQVAAPNLAAPYILYGGGAWDFGLPNANQVAQRDAVAFVENVVVAGAHDFNAWNQLFTIFARDYLWQPEKFIADEIGQLKDGVAATSLNGGNKNALTVKLNQAYNLVAKDKNDEALEVLGGFVDQVNAFASNGKLTAEEADGFLALADQLLFNLGFWE